MSISQPLIPSDTKAYLLFENAKKENIYCIGSLEKDRYIEVKESLKDSILAALHYFDGKNTLESIESKLCENNNIKINISELYKILDKAGLILNSDNVNSPKNEFEKYGINISTLKLDRFYPILKKICKYTNAMIVTSMIIILASTPTLFSILKEMLYINIFKIVDSSGISLFISLLLTTFSVLLHEISHAITATKLGLIPKTLNITLYLYINPIAYIKTHGIYTLEKKKRLYIWLSGVFCNLLLFSSSAILQHFTTGILHNIFIVTCYSNLGLIVMNLVPFLPLDGYFVLSTILKIPNLRKKSFTGFNKLIKSKSFTGIYLFYFIISIITIFYLIFSQVSQIYHNFMLGFTLNNNIFEGLNEIKVYIVFILLIILTKIKTTLNTKKKVG